MSAAGTAGLCPLCGGPNRCARTLPEGERPEPCWCVARRFPKALLDEARRPSCICQACLEAAEQRQGSPSS